MSPLPSQSGGSQGGLPSWACLAPPRLPAPCARAGPPPTTRPPAPRRRFPSRRLVGARPWRALGRGTQAQAGGQPRPWPWPWLCSGCGRRCAPSPAGPPPPPLDVDAGELAAARPALAPPSAAAGAPLPAGVGSGVPGLLGNVGGGPGGRRDQVWLLPGPFPNGHQPPRPAGGRGSRSRPPHPPRFQNARRCLRSRTAEQSVWPQASGGLEPRAEGPPLLPEHTAPLRGPQSPGPRAGAWVREAGPGRASRPLVCAPPPPRPTAASSPSRSPVMPGGASSHGPCHSLHLGLGVLL